MSTTCGRRERLLSDEPPRGSVVLDCDGDAWQRAGSMWFPTTVGLDPLPWAELVSDNGPVRVVHAGRDDA